VAASAAARRRRLEAASAILATAAVTAAATAAAADPSACPAVLSPDIIVIFLHVLLVVVLLLVAGRGGRHRLQQYDSVCWPTDAAAVSVVAVAVGLLAPATTCLAAVLVAREHDPAVPLVGILQARAVLSTSLVALQSLLPSAILTKAYLVGAVGV
jgi:hypothetical protein